MTLPLRTLTSALTFFFQVTQWSSTLAGCSSVLSLGMPGSINITAGPETLAMSWASLLIMAIVSTLPLMVSATTQPLPFQNPIILTDTWEPSSMVKSQKVNPGLQRRTNIEPLKHVGPLIGVPYHKREGRTLSWEHGQELSPWPQVINLFKISTSLNLLSPFSIFCQHSSGIFTSFTPD